MTIAEHFRQELSNRNGYLLEGEANGDLLMIQVQGSQAPYEYETARAFNLEDVGPVLSQLLDSTIGTPTSRGLLCDLEITQEGDSLSFPVNTEWPLLSGPFVFTFADDSRMEFHDSTEIVTRAPRSRGIDPWEELCSSGQVQRAVESLIYFVNRSNLTDLLDADERINLDAAVAALDLLVKSQKPDQRILRECVRWIGSKLDTFADAFAKGAGAAAGATAVSLTLYYADRHVPELRHWVNQLSSMTGS